MRSVILVALTFSAMALIADQTDADVEVATLFWEAEDFSVRVGDVPEVFNIPQADTDTDSVEYTAGTDASGDEFVGTLNNDGRAGSLKYELNLTKGGDWYFWGRAIGPPTGNNSFFWAFDAADEDAVADGPGMNIWDFNERVDPQSDNFPGGDPPPEEVRLGWAWYRISSRAGPFTGGGSYEDPTPISMTAGEHTFHLVVREDGAYMDTLFGTTDVTFDARFIEPAPDLSTAVEALGKLATSWAGLKGGS
jgi:hypothetical protein